MLLRIFIFRYTYPFYLDSDACFIAGIKLQYLYKLYTVHTYLYVRTSQLHVHFQTVGSSFISG